MADDTQDHPASDRLAYRPKNRSGSAKRQRTEGIFVRLSATEKADVAARAERAGLGEAGYARAVLFGGDPGPRAMRRPPADHVAIREILGALGRIGNNLNQIAFKLNRGQDVAFPALQRALDEVMAARAELRIALGKEVADEN